MMLYSTHTNVVLVYWDTFGSSRDIRVNFLSPFWVADFRGQFTVCIFVKSLTTFGFGCICKSMVCDWSVPTWLFSNLKTVSSPQVFIRIFWKSLTHIFLPLLTLQRLIRWMTVTWLFANFGGVCTSAAAFCNAYLCCSSHALQVLFIQRPAACYSPFHPFSHEYRIQSW